MRLLQHFGELVAGGVEDGHAGQRRRVAEHVDHEHAVLDVVHLVAAADDLGVAERLDQERRAAGEKLALVDDAQHKLADAFRALSADALTKNNEAFLDRICVIKVPYCLRASEESEIYRKLLPSP